MRGTQAGADPTEHDASRLHDDFRLEVDGVLKSWAVPKGPSTDPRDKRLAVPTEDHPLDCADFERVIAAGEYGAGTVLVWDRGTYRNPKKQDGEPVPMATTIEDGRVEIWLEGDKLKGGYALVRLRSHRITAYGRASRAARPSRPLAAMVTS